MASFSFSNSTAAGFGGASAAMTVTYKSVIVCVNGSSNATMTGSGGAPSPYVARRGKIYDILIGTNTTPGDTVVQWDVARLTAFGSSATALAGSLSSVSSGVALDQGDFALNATVVVNSSIETGVVVGFELWGVGINQRASYRWVAAPGSEMVYPAVSSQGLDLRALGPSGGGSFTGNVTATVMMTEL